ncbi:MAG: FAD-binding oxidoreductase [Halioglobus sp.]|nr:FAD-binding oxidoreductase [Halioglobus sp.]
MSASDNTELLQALAALVGSDGVLTDAMSLLRYGGERTGGLVHRPSAVALPRTVAQVQRIVQLAVTEGVAIVPVGGATGLSGGAVAQRGELVVALDRLDEIVDFNPVDRTVRCGAGVITAQLQAFAREQGLYYPVDFASSGSSRLGGNIATNAGGTRVIRHGMTRDWVASVKLVSGTGELFDFNRGLVKNNTGYDLRHLVIGAEGTLGIIVEATMRLAPAPRDPAVALLAVADVPAAMSVLSTYRDVLPLTAFELFCAAALEKVLAAGALQRPLAGESPWYVLLEFEQPHGAAGDVPLELFRDCAARGLVSDGVVGRSATQARSLWRLREDISESLAPWTPWKNDIATVPSRLPDLVDDVEALAGELCPDLERVWFGHVGDGNMHLNVLRPAELTAEAFGERCAEFASGLFDILRRHGGSVSAEHGVGLLKKDYLHFTRSAQEVALMRGIKAVFDPHGIMNPGKIFD